MKKIDDDFRRTSSEIDYLDKFVNNIIKFFGRLANSIIELKNDMNEAKLILEIKGIIKGDKNKDTS